jgi:uncharacterized protein YeaO (DUF488 family)
MIKTKSVYSPMERMKDGLRILVTRFRGRGMPTSRYDVWMANLGPSETLLRDFQAGKIAWSEFRRRYRRELREDGTFDRKNKTIKNHGQKFTLRLHIRTRRGGLNWMTLVLGTLLFGATSRQRRARASQRWRRCVR